MSLNKSLFSASTLTNDTIKNNQGDELGNLKDIMLDTETGQIEYYVLSFGGILGLGDKLFAIPPKALTVDTEEECLVLNVEKDLLEKAPGFDKDVWPDMADSAFRDKIYGYYGYEYTQGTRAA